MRMFDKQQTEQFRAGLSQFFGSDQWTRWNPVLFKDIIASQGMMYVAEQAGAYWLLDAIASHEACNPQVVNAAQKHPAFDSLHFWTLTVTDSEATLVCQADSGEPEIVRQEIPLTDFPIQGDFKVYAGNDGPGTLRKLFLPSEY